MATELAEARGSTRERVLRVLADGRFHSGQVLGAELGLSRAAIAKAVDGLRDWGVQVDAVTGRGYRCPAPIELLELPAIRQGLPTELAGRLDLEVVTSIGSTNRVLLERARAGDGPRALFAERQTEGRGRWGRQWISPFGRSLAFSLLWQMPTVPGGVAAVGLAVGVELAEALRAHGAQEIGLKWPNDVIAPGGKLGGVLVELVGEPAGPCVLVIGFGLNLALNEAERSAVGQPVVDLASLLGTRQLPLSRNALAGRLLSAVATACEGYASAGLAAYRERWTALDAYAGCPVDIQLPNGTISGIERGIDPSGALQVETDEGLRSYASGDLRLRLRQ